MQTQMKIGTRLMLAFLLVAVIAGMTGMMGTYLTNYIGEKGEIVGMELAPLGDAAMEIKLTAAMARVSLDELIKNPDDFKEEKVWNLLQESLWYSNAILRGDENDEGRFIASNDPDVREKITQTQQKIESFLQISRKRYLASKQTSSAGSAIDQNFDGLYRSIMKNLDRISAQYKNEAQETEIVFKIGETKFLLTKGHLFLEELLSGDMSNRMEDILDDFNSAKAIFETLAPIIGKDQVEDLSQRIVAFIKVAEERYETTTHYNKVMSDLEETFNEQFSTFIQTADDAEELIHDTMDKGLLDLGKALEQTRIWMLVTSLSAFLLAFLFGTFISQTIKQPIQTLVRALDRMSQGDLTVKVDLKTGDELGYLANSFNNMAESMRVQMKIQHGVAEINDTMVAAKDVSDFSRELLKDIMEITDSQLGAFYLLSGDQQQFEHFTSIGGNSDLLQPFAAATMEGEIGRTLRSKQISHIENIPQDTVFQLKTFIGSATPTAMITLPILIRDEVMAIITLASFHSYSKEHLEIVNQASIGINTSFSNLWANENTRKLAEELQNKNVLLEAQAGELRAQAVELQNQSEEFQQQNLELEAQRQQVEEANRLKSEFLSNMSHELRTPLNSIMALSRVLILQAQDNLSAEQGEYLEIIERNGKQLLALINDILDLSKIEAGRMDVSLRWFSPETTIETIVESLELIAKEKGITITQQIANNFPEIESDELRVHKILQNIIGNAVKFTEQGSINIKAFREKEAVVIQVMDTGIGISKEDVPHIFEEFRQVDGSSSRRFEGTGLGLSIANKTAKMLGGTISVQSTLGQGSKFIITLPIEWQGIAPTYEPLSFPLATPQSKKKTILIVDDNPQVVTMISNYLSEEGYHTVIATSGQKALELAEVHHPFAITLDVIMPEMDGWETLQNLKKNKKTANIPVIVISVADDQETGFALGAVGYLTKPVHKEILISEIRTIDGAHPYSIMVVDDNKIDRLEMTRILEEEKMKVISVESGRKCLELLKQSIPDVLVLDLMMPEMDGFMVLDRLRNDPSTKNLPVIVVTAKDLTTEEKNKLETHASSILGKSNLDTKSLLQEIEKQLTTIEKVSKSLRSLETKESHHLLLVEDNEIAITQVKRTLEGVGYSVEAVRGGQEAIDYIEHTVPDGIILDLMMPEVDGFAVLEKIRSMEATAGIPVLILTAKDLTKEDLAKLSSNHIQQLIQKGDVDRDGLLHKVQHMLAPIAENFPESPLPEKETSHPVPNSQDAIATRASREKPIILVIEDTPDNMVLIRAILKDKYEILEAVDGLEGLEKTISELPDLVLLDMALPKMDGFTVVQKIREHKQTQMIPVIAVTARAMKGDREKTIEAGCNDYIAKPIDVDEIVDKIEKWM